MPTIISAEKYEGYDPGPIKRFEHLKFGTNKKYKNIDEFLEELERESEKKIAEIGLDEIQKNTPGFVRGKEKT